MSENQTPDLDALAKYFVGNNARYRENIIIPRSLAPVYIKSREEKLIESTMESCVFKSVVSCALGEFRLRFVIQSQCQRSYYYNRIPEVQSKLVG